MSARIDHAARAAALVAPAGALGTVDSINEKRIAAAQVHATLALVEQQRIANLIALGRFVELPADWPKKRILVYRPTNIPGDAIAAEIREALGLS